MRTTTWILAIMLAFSVKAAGQDVKPGAFGQAGYVTKDELAKLTYGPKRNDLALAAYVPHARVPVGEPLWAYFVVKNDGGSTQGLDMRFDFVTGQTHLTVNSCGFTVKPLTEGAKLGKQLRSHMWSCGSGSLVDVVSKGYYVAAIDLAAWGDLSPGDYEVSWRYAGHTSNTVRFTVLDGAKPAPSVKQRNWNLWELRSGSDRQLRVAKEEAKQEKWAPTRMRAWYQGDFSAALGSGVGARHVTNLEKLPSSDELLSMSVAWTLGDKIDRVTLRLDAKDPKVRVGLDKLHVYLLADTPRNSPGDEAGRDVRAEAIRVTPYTIELHLPAYWRTRPKDDFKVAETFQASILVTAQPLRPPQRNRQFLEEARVERVRADKPPRIWDGLLRTSFHSVAWQEEQPGWTALQIWDHFSQIPGDQIQKQKLTPAEAAKIQEDKTNRQTGEVVGKEPNDAGSLRFYYSTDKGIYWMRRVNLRNPSNSDWMAGPFELPKKK